MSYKYLSIYHEQPRTDAGDLLFPGFALHLASALLAGRLPAVLYVVHFRETDRTLAGRSFRLHNLCLCFCNMHTQLQGKSSRGESFRPRQAPSRREGKVSSFVRREYVVKVPGSFTLAFTSGNFRDLIEI